MMMCNPIAHPSASHCHPIGRANMGADVERREIETTDVSTEPANASPRRCVEAVWGEIEPNCPKTRKSSPRLRFFAGDGVLGGWLNWQDANTEAFEKLCACNAIGLLIDKWQSTAYDAGMEQKLTRQLKQFMTDSGLSEYEIAKRAGISAAALTRLTRGERSLTVTTLEKLAVVLNLELRQTRKPSTLKRK